MNKIVIVMIVAVVGAVLALAMIPAALFGSSSAAACPAPGSASESTPAAVVASMTTGVTGSPLPTVAGWDIEQTGYARLIVTVGAARRVPAHGWVIAVAVAMQESSLRNPPGGDQDSIGLFQQRPSQGWGSPAQLNDPAYQAAKFFDALLAVPGWQAMALTDAANAVQRSATPDAYAARAAEAARMVTALTGVTVPDLAPGTGGCAGATVPPGGWTQPVHAEIGSGFRTADRPSHDGVDLLAARGTPVLAAATGTVSTVQCNTDPISWGCGRDGGQQIRGCGWYVDLAHPSGVITRYCHLGARPTNPATGAPLVVGDTVAAGQPFGVVGSTGNSSGPHLHFEVHVGGDSGDSGAIEPVGFMASHGAPLGS